MDGLWCDAICKQRIRFNKKCEINKKEIQHLVHDIISVLVEIHFVVGHLWKKKSREKLLLIGLKNLTKESIEKKYVE